MYIYNIQSYFCESDYINIYWKAWRNACHQARDLFISLLLLIKKFNGEGMQSAFLANRS